MKHWYYFKASFTEQGYPLYAKVTMLGHFAPYFGAVTCQNQARNHGATAVFHETESEARAALLMSMSK